MLVWLLMVVSIIFNFHQKYKDKIYQCLALKASNTADDSCAVHELCVSCIISGET